MSTKAVLTYSDYAALPDDGRRYELHRGELSVTPAPGIRHQRALIALGSRLYEYVRSQGLGETFVAPTDCILSDVTVVQPDVLYVANNRLSIISERCIEGAPTLAVEVSFPSSSRIDRDRKLKLYTEHELPYYWIVDPVGRSVEAYKLTDREYVLVGSVANQPAALPPFTDLQIDPAALWS